MSILRIAVALAILVIWAAIYLRAAFGAPGFNAPPELSGMALAAATFLLGSEFKKSIERKAAAVAKRLSEDESDEEAKA